MNGEFTYQEIKGQGKAWSESLSQADIQFEPIRDYLHQSWSDVLFTGCGSTHYLALTAAARWQSLTHMRARGVPASEIWLYPQTILPSEAPLLIAVSRSGATTETFRAVQLYKDRFKHDPVVISCYPENELVASSPYTLLTTGAEEKSVAQTKSFTSMLLMAQFLALKASARSKELDGQMQRLPERFDALVQKNEDAIKALAGEDQFQKFVFLGSGINFGLASEAMLKMKEMSLSISEVFHFMEFRHGPMSVVADDTLVIGLLDDATQDEELKVLSEMQRIGAKTLALGESLQNAHADYVFELESEVDPLLRGPLYIPLLQLLAYYKAMHKGLDPDNPKNLTVFVDLSD